MIVVKNVSVCVINIGYCIFHQHEFLYVLSTYVYVFVINTDFCMCYMFLCVLSAYVSVCVINTGFCMCYQHRFLYVLSTGGSTHGRFHESLHLLLVSLLLLHPSTCNVNINTWRLFTLHCQHGLLSFVYLECAFCSSPVMVNIATFQVVSLK